MEGEEPVVTVEITATWAHGELPAAYRGALLHALRSLPSQFFSVHCTYHKLGSERIQINKR